MSRLPKRIAIATGTRADWGLLLPLARKLQSLGNIVTILATNAHLDHRLGNTGNEIVDDGFNPIYIDTTAADSDPAHICGLATIGFSRWLSENRPDRIVILGDRFEMLGVASAAMLNKIPIVHIAGGTVSEGAIDNTIRDAISTMATLHLVETPKCKARLENKGISKNMIHVCGALGVYNVMQTPIMSGHQLEASIGQHLPNPFILATLHAATLDSISPLQQMNEFIKGCELFLSGHPDFGFLFTYPNNDVDPMPQINLIEDFRKRHPRNVVIVPSLGRVRYMSALYYAQAVAGNSSSGIVEVPSMGVPVVDVGIRQRGRECGPGVIHSPHVAADIVKALDIAVSEDFRIIAQQRINPYYRENTPALMARFISNRLEFK